MNNFDYHLLANFQDFFIRHRGVYIYLIIINLVTFAVFGIDKFNTSSFKNTGGYTFQTFSDRRLHRRTGGNVSVSP